MTRAVAYISTGVRHLDEDSYKHILKSGEKSNNLVFSSFSVDDEFEDSAAKPGAVDPDVIEEEEEDEEEESEDVIMDDFEDEFETEDSSESSKGPSSSSQENQPPPIVTPPKPIKAAEIPNHLRTNWDSFVIEMIVCSGLFAYLVNFFVGKSKNYKLANAWLTSHRGIFESNFSIIGDDGSGTEAINGVLMKESENVYALWCSGRSCVEGMLCELKLLKRQCLVGVLSNMLKPGKSDQLHIRVDMNKEDMDTFVMAVGNKKSIARMAKDLTDLNSLCGEKKSGEKLGLGSNVAVISEIGEASSAVLDSKVLALLSKHEDCLDSIHITDQYTGAKADATSDANSSSKNPLEPLKQIRCVFNVPGKGKSKPEDVEALRPMVQLVFHLIDKIKRVRLSKEAKRKADGNRAKIEGMRFWLGS